MATCRSRRAVAWAAACWLVVLLASDRAFGKIMARHVGPQPRPTQPGSAPGGSGTKLSGLHIPQGRNVSFTYTMNDGAGFRWDIQYYGTVGQGTNYAYAGGLYCQVNNSNIHSSGRGWLNTTGDEVEIGPYSRSNLRIYRRIKVYKDRGLARWMDIFENPTGGDITIGVRIYTNTNWQISNRFFGSGKGTFTAKDVGFITESQSGNNPPALWHYVCTKRSKLRPTVNITGNQIYVNWSLKIPAKKTIVLCYFESQNHSAAALKKQLKAFRPYRALRDLSPAVRKLIVNMPGGLDLEGIELERSESGDVVLNRNSDPIYGEITNAKFALETYFGKMDLPAEQLIGMAHTGGQENVFRALLVGGQVIAGRMADDARVQVRLPAGGELKVPFGDIQQWAFRISKQRPEEMAFSGPVVILRTGDRVALRAETLQLKLRTRHGTVPLAAGDLLKITLDNAGNAVHRVTFLNGSRLAGFLEPERIPFTLRLGPQLAVPRDLVAQVQFAEEERPDGTLDAVTLSNGDELFGRLTTESFTVQTDYGAVTLKPENVQGMSFSRTHLGRGVLKLWDGSILRGQCRQETLAFQIVPGPTIDIYLGQFVSIRRNQALPPKEIREKLQRLVGQLGAESYKDRQAASEALIKMGKGIVPLLKKYLSTSDPEVRQRIEEVIERLGGSAPAAPAGPPVPTILNAIRR
jgi:hypothetical protein